MGSKFPNMKLLPFTALMLLAQLALGQTNLMANKFKKYLTEGTQRTVRMQSTYKPDTILVFNRSGVTPVEDGRWIYTYDNQNRVTRISVESKDTGFWEELRRLELTYGTGGQIIQADKSYRVAGILTLSERKVRRYNAAGRIISNTVFDFSNGVANQVGGDSLVYNGTGVNPTSIDYIGFDSGTSSWSSGFRFRNFTFNAQNQLTNASYALPAGAFFADILRFQNAEWKAGYPGLVEVLLGDGFSSMISDEFSWEPTALSWFGPSQGTVQENNIGGSGWKNIERRTHSLNGTTLSAITEESWIDTLPVPAWVPSLQTGFTFSNNLISSLTKLTPVMGGFINDSKEVNEYNGPQNLVSKAETLTWINNNWVRDNLNEYFYGLDPQSRIQYLAKTMSVFGAQLPSDSLSFRYRTSTSTSDIPAAKAQLFPNPSSQGWAAMQFEQPFTGQVMVSDLSGKVLQHQFINGETRCNLNINGLAKGLYLVQWTDQEKRSNTEKLQIQ